MDRPYVQLRRSEGDAMRTYNRLAAIRHSFYPKTFNSIGAGPISFQPQSTGVSLGDLSSNFTVWRHSFIRFCSAKGKALPYEFALAEKHVSHNLFPRDIRVEQQHVSIKDILLFDLHLENEMATNCDNIAIIATCCRPINTKITRGVHFQEQSIFVHCITLPCVIGW